MGKKTFEIPDLMKEHERTMKKELADASEEELRKLSRLSEAQIESMMGFEEKEQEYIDQGGARFRKIHVLQKDMLKNGMKVQVAVCDPWDKNFFHPLDKVLVFNKKDKYYATGSFCGFDFTDLNEGVFLGDKISCPTCGSIYNITNGLVEQGPSMRNISSFPINVRKKKVQLVVPEHIPAFSMRETLTRDDIDPRSIIIVGDSAAALSAIVTLRYGFVGRIILIPTSTEGSFENKDALVRKFGPLSKEEVYLVEPDLFQKANVEVWNTKITKIDHDERMVYTKDNKKIPFEAILFAGSSTKVSPSNYVNVHCLNDYESHANAHNNVIKSNHVAVLGSTFEAFQIASSIRSYLNSIDKEDVKITLMDHDIPEVLKTLGYPLTERIYKEFKKMGISVIRDAKITHFDGDYKLRRIRFRFNDRKDNEYFIRPDAVIAEGHLGKVDHNMHSTIYFDKPKFRPQLNADGAFKIDKRFSIMVNINYQGMFACGENAMHRSFLGNKPFRTSDLKFNIESGFYAALNMMYKDVKMEYLPLTRLTLGDTEIYYYGERNNVFDDIAIDGDINGDKFVVYYLRDNVVCGFATFGFKNLHLYLIEAMKLLMMPDGKLQKVNRFRNYFEAEGRLIQGHCQHGHDGER